MTEQIKQAMAQAKASVQLETSFKLTQQHDDLVSGVLTGEITHEEFFKKVDEIVFDKKS